MSSIEIRETMTKYVSQAADNTYLSMIYAMMQAYEAEKVLETGNQGIKAYNDELDQAVKEIEQGEFITHQQVIEEAKKW